MKKIKFFIFTFLLILFLLNFKIIKVQGNSMEPTIKSNSFVIVDKYLHKIFEIQKNDIMLFEVENHEVVKKIVGFPNEKLKIEGSQVSLSSKEIYVLGENLKESIDSRTYGPLKINQIIGKVVLVF